MSELDVVSAIAGGALIGTASVTLLALNGKIAGISGILHDLFRPPSPEIQWRMAFLGGLLLVGLGAAVFGARPQQLADHSLVLLAVAGVLVGVGTRMANGCTSGHGVCGLGRLSPRSFTAVLSFLAAGFVTTFVMRHAVPVLARWVQS